MLTISSVKELLLRCPPVVRTSSGEGDGGREVAITGNTRLLLLTLYLHGSPGDPTVCTLSRPELMRLTAMCKATLDSQIRVLKDSGLLLKKKEKMKIDGKWRNVWRLSLTPLNLVDGSRSAVAPTPRELTCDDKEVIATVREFVDRLEPVLCCQIQRRYLRGHESFCIQEVKRIHPQAKIEKSYESINVYI